MVKSVVVKGPQEFIFEELTPEIVCGQNARIRVKKIGFCASDVKIFNGKHPFVRYPVIPGHEFSGEVIETGKECTKVHEGDRVAVFPLFGCETCEFCQQGQVNRCGDLGIVGVNKNGGFCEEIVLHEKHLLSLPPEVSYTQAAVAEPLAVAIHACRRAKCGSNDRIAVLGTGPIGLLIIQLAKSLGSNIVLVTDFYDNRLRMAEKLGAKYTNKITQQTAEKINSNHKGKFDIVFDCVGIIDTLKQGLHLTCSGGRIILVGLPSKEWDRVPVSVFFKKELSLIVTRVYDRFDFAQSIDFLRNGKVDINSIITHDLNLLKVKEAFYLGESAQGKSIKILLSP
jgi:2-desacetyl-2-hydroxyethyl bacteriochlorophyllide A dehydrogenase